MDMTLLKREIHHIKLKNRHRNIKVWNNKNEEANGPSFLNQNTVFTL
jgi:hypothetical protein